jgi:uncharacterized OB-fold protein
MSDMQAIADNLYTQEPSLIGSECTACEEVFFPAQVSCSNCSCQDMRAKDLGQSGTLWSWTLQHYQPKPPYNSGETASTFKAFGVGLIEMECGIKIKSRLHAADLTQFRIGDKMSLVLLPFRQGSEGSKTRSTFAFKREGE